MIVVEINRFMVVVVFLGDDVDIVVSLGEPDDAPKSVVPGRSDGNDLFGKRVDDFDARAGNGGAVVGIVSPFVDGSNGQIGLDLAFGAEFEADAKPGIAVMKN